MADEHTLAAKEEVRRYYGEIARRLAGGDTTANSCCDTALKCCSGGEDSSISPFGCGNPVKLAELRPGENVLDLGSGPGIDAIFAARQVGSVGFVTGVDLADEMIELSRQLAAKNDVTNVKFVKGEIESLPVAAHSIDVIISNCVINLSTNKAAVFKEMYRALKPGGRIAILDIAAETELPKALKENPTLYVRCVAGAVPISSISKMLHQVGFENVRITPTSSCTEAGSLVLSVKIQATKPKDKAMGQKEYFDHVANEWDSLRQEFFTEGVRQKAVAAARPRPGAIAADIGAGTGFLTEELLRHGLNVIALDQSSAMIEAMKRKFPNETVIQYRLVESESLPLNDHSVDYAFANMYLHHVESPERSIREMARILKPGGRLTFTDLDEHTFEFLRVEQHDRWMGFRREEVRRWMTEAGLIDVEVKSVGEECCATSCASGEPARVGIFLATGVIPTRS